MTAPSIKVEHVNPFITSTMETFGKMVGCPAKPGKLIVKKDQATDYDISGIIGISGGAKGMISLSFPKETAIKVTNRFIGAENSDVNGEIKDAIGELANIVAGYAKRGLGEFDITISLPSVIMGAGHQILEPKDVFSFIVPFTTELGPFHLTVSLKSGD